MSTILQKTTATLADGEAGIRVINNHLSAPVVSGEKAFIAGIRNDLRAGMAERFYLRPQARGDQLVLASCVLDPRYKDTDVLPAGLRSTAVDSMRNMLRQQEARATCEAQGQVVTDVSRVPILDTFRGGTPHDRPTNESATERALECWRRMPGLRSSEDPIGPWFAAAEAHPDFGPIVEAGTDALAACPTSATVEREGSTGTNIVTARRYRMKPQTVCMLMFMKENLGEWE